MAWYVHRDVHRPDDWPIKRVSTTYKKTGKIRTKRKSIILQYPSFNYRVACFLFFQYSWLVWIHQVCCTLVLYQISCRPRLGRIPHHSISRKSEDRSELLDPARRNRRCNAAANGNIWHHCLVDFPVVNSHLSTSLAPSDRSEVTIGGSRRDKITKLLVGKTGAEKYPSRNTKTVNYGRPIGILRWKKIRSFYRLRELVGVSMDRISSY